MKDLARRLLAIEAARAEAAAAPGDAAVRVCAKLQTPLIRLTGLAGYSSLLARALVLAKSEAPSLLAVSVRPDGSLAGLDAIENDPDAGKFEEARVVLVAHLLGLLATFIGEFLTLRLVRDVWPDVAFDSPGLKGEKNHEFAGQSHDSPATDRRAGSR